MITLEEPPVLDDEDELFELLDDPPVELLLLELVVPAFAFGVCELVVFVPVIVPPL